MFFQSVIMEWFSISLCPHQFLSSVLSPLWLGLFLGILLFLVTILHGIFFLISLSAASLLVCRNATDFCTLICILRLYWIHFSSGSSWVESFRFSIHSITSPANSESLISSLPIWMLLFLFVVWLLRLGLPVLCWTKVVRVDIPVLFLNVEEKLSVFPHLGWF